MPEQQEQQVPPTELPKLPTEEERLKEARMAWMLLLIATEQFFGPLQTEAAAEKGEAHA